MTKLEFRSLMTLHGVRPDSFDIDDSSSDECWVSRRINSQWVVFYAQRGTMSAVEYFPSEGEALAYLSGVILRDSVARRS